MSEESRGGLVGRNVLYLVAGTAVSKVALLLVLAILARYLGAAEFGRLAFAIAAALLFEAVNDVGLTQVIARDAAGRLEQLRRDVVAVAPYKIALSALSVALAVAIASTAASADLVEIAFWIALAHALIGLTALPRAVFEAAERMEFEALSVALEGVMRLLLVVYAFLSGFGVLGIAKAYAVAAFAVLVASAIVALRRFLVPLALRPDLRRGLALVAAGLPFAGFTLLQAATYRFDTIALGALFDETVVGWFAGAARLVESALVLPGLIAAALLPATARHRRSDPRVARTLLVSSQKIMVLSGGLLAVLTWAAAPALVSLVLGPRFSEAIPVLRVLALGLVAYFARQALARSIFAAGRAGALLRAQAAIFMLNVAALAALAPTGAAVGAATAIALSEVFGFVVSLTLVRRDLTPADVAAISRSVGVVLAGIVAALALEALPLAWSVALVGVAFGVAALLLRPLAPAELVYVRNAVSAVTLRR